MFVHSADKLAEMRTKFHVIQAKLIMSVWCFTVQWQTSLVSDPSSGSLHKAQRLSLTPDRQQQEQTKNVPTKLKFVSQLLRSE